ncbi:MAG: peptidase M14, partial [Cyclobacteriaceae bacterium]|nr:peptidase M14 [Cyclobacteriaceae bacterium]
NNYTKGMSFSKWASTLDDISLASTIEFPYSNVSGIQVSKDGARIFGKAIAYSIKDYLLHIE